MDALDHRSKPCRRPSLAPTRRSLVLTGLGGVALGALAGCGEAQTDAVAIGGPFELIDHTGAPFTDRDLRGRPFIVFFGFTFCPDACPLALTKVAIALDSLGADADRFQTVFISIDPERDTPEQLALYTQGNGFPRNLIGLTGSPEAIAAVAQAYRVHYKKIESEETTAGYLMEHSTVLYLMDARGRFAGVFTHASTPDEIAEGLRQHLAQG
jgi:protein SCO1/2